jgi:hypothetical protein
LILEGLLEGLKSLIIKYLKKDNQKNCMEMVSIPKAKLEQMKQEIKTLRKTKLYKRLIEFEENIVKGKKYTRKDLGF